MPEDLLMKDKRQTAIVDTCGKLDFQERTSVVESNSKKGGRCGNVRLLWIKLLKILLTPLINSV
jgi:hypothetical protein